MKAAKVMKKKGKELLVSDATTNAIIPTGIRMVFGAVPIVNMLLYQSPTGKAISCVVIEVSLFLKSPQNARGIAIAARIIIGTLRFPSEKTPGLKFSRQDTDAPAFANHSL